MQLAKPADYCVNVVEYHEYTNVHEVEGEDAEIEQEVETEVLGVMTVVDAIKHIRDLGPWDNIQFNGDDAIFYPADGHINYQTGEEERVQVAINGEEEMVAGVVGIIEEAERIRGRVTIGPWVEDHEERGERNVLLYYGIPKVIGIEIMAFWGEDTAQAFEDGFLDPRDVAGSAYDYAISLGLWRE
jgi:hypothetical protein